MRGSTLPSLLVLPSSSRAAPSLGRQSVPAQVSDAAGRGSRVGRHAAAGGRGGRLTPSGAGAGLRAAEASGGPGCSCGVESAHEWLLKAGIGLWSRPGPLCSDWLQSVSPFPGSPASE